MCQASPSECHSSVSLLDKQLDSSSMASYVRSGTTTRDGRFGTVFDSCDASTMSVSGENRKCTSSGAFGSWMCDLSLAFGLLGFLEIFF